MAAVLLGLSPLLAFEGVCLLFGWGRPSVHDDPFVGFRGVQPLFVASDDGSRYEIPKARQAFFRPESFAAKKPRDAYRIFCLGGSTVQGRPFAIETSFTTWLELSLEAADPSRPFEVINCGGVSYASYRLVPILEEVLQYEPDLIVLYTGHNEFLEDRTFDHIQRRGRLLNASLELASHTRTFNLLREGYLRASGVPTEPEGRPILPTEVEALLDYKGGLEEYHRDDDRRQGVIAHYRYNVGRMVRMAEEAGVPMILVNPVANLRHSPPFKSEHRADLTPAELARWQALCESAASHLRREHYDLYQAIDEYEQACRLDPLHAGGFFNLARCYEAAGKLDLAREAFVQAKELDVCPLRIVEPMHEAVLEIAEASGTPLLDAQALFAGRTPSGIVGSDWLVDHVHPSIEGHQLLADALAGMLVEQGVVTPRPEWEEAKREHFREHFASLDDLYFLRGTRRLTSLKEWAQGRSELLRPETGDAKEMPDDADGQE